MSRAARRAGLCAALSAMAPLASPAGAGAAQPVRGVSYSQCTARSCQVVFAVTPDGRYVRGFFASARCGPAPVLGRMHISRRGWFSFHGRRGHLTVSVSGRFTSPFRATGTVRYRRARCDSGAVRFDAAPGD